MAFSTFNAIFGSPPAGVSPAQAAQFSAAQRLARQRALSAFAAGLSSYNENPYASSFGQFAHALGSSLAQGQQFDAMKQAQYNQQLAMQRQAMMDQSLLQDRQSARTYRDARIAAIQDKPASGSKTLAQKFEEFRAAFGRDPNDAEKARIAGTYVAPEAGGGKDFAFQSNIKYLMDHGYSFGDALSLYQKLLPTITTGTIYDALRGVTLPTTGSRTPQLPSPTPAVGAAPVGLVPSHARKRQPLNSIFGG